MAKLKTQFAMQGSHNNMENTNIHCQFTQIHLLTTWVTFIICNTRVDKVTENICRMYMFRNKRYEVLFSQATLINWLFYAPNILLSKNCLLKTIFLCQCFKRTNHSRVKTTYIHDEENVKIISKEGPPV